MARPPARAGDGLARRTALVWTAALLVLLASQSGRIFFDTKLGVDISPVAFAARLWQLWDPIQWFGTLQDQYIGYAFPMLPFYLLGHVLAVPVWVTERLWVASLIAAGFAGMSRLAAALGIGSSRTRLVAGLAFALWPAFTVVIGSTSAGILPGLFAPWAVLPLVTARRGGPVARAAARSAVAVLFMGGVNATCTLDALILPAVFIVTQFRGRRLAVLAAAWTGAVALATSWWVVPLLLQGRYSVNFLPYVEQTATTMATMSAAAFLRGTGNWTAYLNLGRPWLPAGWLMVASPLPVLAAATASAAGLAGLARRDIREGGWLRLALAVTVLIALIGYPGPLGGPLHQPIDAALNGLLAPLRSVYKVEPAAAAVLALGLAHLLARVPGRPAGRAGRRIGPLVARLAVAPVGVVVLAGLASPYLSGQVLNPGSFSRVPRYWYRVAAFLRAHSPDAPALVVPAQAHGYYLWGQTVDDVLEALAGSPWVARGLVPYGGPGSQLLLESLETALTSGARAPGLAATLARSGIGYIVVRNDLSPAAIGYQPTGLVHQTLARSGFVRVAAFGPRIAGALTAPGAGPLRYVLPSYPAVEIYAARPGARPPPPAAALPVRGTVFLNGGPGALIRLAGQGVIGPGQPVVMAGDPLVTRPALWAVTDTLRRADHAFGLISDATSYTYTATGRNPPDDPLGAAGGPPRLLAPPAAPLTVSVLAGAASVTASSSGTWLAEDPQSDPVNAFDGDPATAWTEASPVSAVGQWIQITFAHPVRLPDRIGIALLVGGAGRPVADRLTARTSAGSVTSSVRRTPAVQSLAVRPGRTRSLRITIAGARGGWPGGPGAGFTQILVPGVRVRRLLVPAQSPAGRAAPAIAFSFGQHLPWPGSLTNLAAYPPLADAFTTAAPAGFRFAGTALPAPGPALTGLLERLTPRRRDSVVVTATSTFGSLPRLAPANLFLTGRHGSWIAAGRHAAISIRWHGMRRISELVLQPVPGFSAAPRVIEITSPDGTRYASVGLDGMTEIVPPLRTDRIRISFSLVQDLPAPGPGGSGPLPVGLSRLSIPALAGLHAVRLNPAVGFSLPCGSGPAVTLDGRTFLTSVAGTIGDLTALDPVRVRLCAPGSAARLPAGRHRLLAAAPGAFAFTGIALTDYRGRACAPPCGPAGGGTRTRTVTVLSWGAGHRVARIGGGPAAYLEVHQNANVGWTATMRGRRLRPVVLDGWQQGFVVPSGTGGIITLSFSPTKLYHIWIIVSGCGVLALVLAAVGRRRRGRVCQPMDQELDTTGEPLPGGIGAAVTGWPTESLSRSPAGLAPAGLAPAGLAPAGLAPAGLAPAGRPPVSLAVALGGLALLLALVGGPVALAVPVLAAIGYLWPSWCAPISFAAALAAGLVTALAPDAAAPATGAFGGPAQACALIALTAALIPVCPPRRRVPRSGRAEP